MTMHSDGEQQTKVQNDPATSYFAEQIRLARKKMGENQTQFAKRFGVATNSISRYETGTYQAPYEIILWCLMETDQLQDDIPTSLQHANLAIDQLQKVIEALTKEASHSHLIEEVEKLKVPNSDIDQFGCYNTEGNIRMQDGYNMAINQVISLLKRKGESEK